MERYAIESEFAGFKRVYYSLESAINALPEALRGQWKENVYARTTYGYKTFAEIESPKPKKRWWNR